MLADCILINLSMYTYTSAQRVIFFADRLPDTLSRFQGGMSLHKHTQCLISHSESLVDPGNEQVYYLY